MKLKVLFVCTHNSARSQMAEAFLNALYGERFEAYSAGTHPGTLNSYVVKAMKEIGIDISNNKTKSVMDFKGKRFDYVVTVCDQAREECPYFPGALQYIHKGFEDPSTFTGSDEEIMEKVRKLRDEIEQWIMETFKKI
ncbi:MULTISPECIES: arsenate reductase ArsC [Caldisericum]|uniref:arsenate reductase ArsC n=1 Tax=Caldisericum TaxID=693074 RepID=UPI0039FBA60B